MHHFSHDFIYFDRKERKKEKSELGKWKKERKKERKKDRKELGKSKKERKKERKKEKS